MGACGLAAAALTVVSVRTQAPVVRCQCLHPKQSMAPCRGTRTACVLDSQAQLSLLARARRGALLGVRTACCVTQQIPGCPASSAVTATR